jgi:hypothetical protein
MKKILPILACLALTGCLGDSSRDNTLVGQVKRVHYNTPIVCGDWAEVDISLGVMQGGTGSVSIRDLYLWVPKAEDAKFLENNNGKIVKITYDIQRATFCVDNEKVTKVEVISK